MDDSSGPEVQALLGDGALRAGLGCRAGNRAGQAGLGRANSGLGQNRARPKLAQFFRAKILIAQPALKIGLVWPNSLLKEKKIRADWVGNIGPGQI